MVSTCSYNARNYASGTYQRVTIGRCLEKRKAVQFLGCRGEDDLLLCVVVESISLNSVANKG